MMRVNAKLSHRIRLSAPQVGAVEPELGLPLLPRLARFVLVGGTCAALQLLVFAGVLRFGAEPHLANTGAFLLSTQLNFFLSAAITWRDRMTLTGGRTAIGIRLATYNTMALGTLLLNQLAFTLAVTHFPALLASGVGIAASAVANYLLSRSLIFRDVSERIKHEHAGAIHV